MKNFWLVKQEPSSYSWSDFVAEGQTSWTGVRNYAARNNLRRMRKGDEVLFYHSGEEKAVVGIAKVIRTAYPDPTAKQGGALPEAPRRLGNSEGFRERGRRSLEAGWSTVDLAVVKPLRRAGGAPRDQGQSAAENNSSGSAIALIGGAVNQGGVSRSNQDERPPCVILSRAEGPGATAPSRNGIPRLRSE
jgi:predicted RNA-binding protein with PUA-like domain